MSLSVQKLCFSAALFPALFALIAPLAAQSNTTGGLAGVVVDNGKMVIPGATITLRNESTNQAQNIKADNKGAFRFSLLAPGSYELYFASRGFKTARAPGVVVNLTETPNVEAVLEPGTAASAIVCTCTVSAGGSSTGTLMDEKTITAVPLNTRNATQVLSISSGSAADVSNAGNLGRNNQAVNVNGNTTAGSLTVDGAVAPSATPNPDTISELKIDTSQYDAGFGAQVPATNVVTRSGTNQFHGVAWDFLRNDIFNANAFFRNATRQSKPNLKQNQFGGTLGGPIVKDRLFFFLSYQGTLQTNGLDPTASSTIVLPRLTEDRSAATIAAAFCPANHPGDARYQTFAGGKQLDCANGNTATTAPIHPVALRILQTKLPDGSYLIPVPQTFLSTGANAGLGFSSYSLPSTYREHQYLLNTDYIVSAKHTVYLRFFSARVDQYRSFGSPTGFPGTAVVPGAGAPQQLDSTDYLGAFRLNSTLSPRFTNEFRAGFSRNNNFTFSVGGLDAAPFGIKPVNPKLGLPPEVTILGPLGTFRFFGNGSNDFATTTRSTVFADNLSWVRAKHSVRFGGAYQSSENTRNDTSVSRGKITFQSFSDFLLGLSAAQNLSPAGRSNIQSVQANLGSGPNGEAQYQYQRPYFATYIQDDFRVTSRLTLNMGLRWEYIAASTDPSGTIGGIDMNAMRAAAIPPLAGTLLGNTVASNYDPSLINPYTGQPFGTPPAGVTVRPTSTFYASGAPRDTVAPRFGMAWRPSKTNRIAIRGGIGWFYQSPSAFGVAANPLFTAPPFAQSFTNNDASNGASTWDKPFPTVTLGYVLRTPTSQLSDRVAGPDFRIPRLTQWNFSIQTSLTKTLTLDIGYVGSNGNNLMRSRVLNQPSLASASSPVNCGYTGVAADCITTNSAINARLRVPIMGENPNALVAHEFAGLSNYQSLQATLRKSLSHGLGFAFSYTVGRAMSDLTVINDQNNPRLGWARNFFDRRHRVTVNFSYALPSTRARGLLGGALNGWSATGLVILQSGAPLTLTDPFAGAVYGRPATSTITTCPGATYQDLTTAGTINERLTNWFNPSAICSAAVIGSDRNATGYGTAGGSIVVGPNQFNTDFSIGKTGHVGGVGEGGQLGFRMEMYNALNHSQFANPGVTFGTATFGVITQTSVAPRIIQFALKYAF